MKIWCLQHVEPEGPGLISNWASQRGHALERVELFRGEDLPAPSSQDALLIMGGPMSVHDVDAYPFLAGEMQLIRRHAAAGGRIFGVCLGAQLIATALGGLVTKNKHREIGWFPVQAVPACEVWSGLSPEQLMVLHWHGETFSLPERAELLCSSAGCVNQGFAIGTKIIGLQFHMEVDATAVAAFVQAFPEDCSVPSTFVQTGDAVLADTERYSADCAEVLYRLLDIWAS